MQALSDLSVSARAAGTEGTVMLNRLVPAPGGCGRGRTLKHVNGPELGRVLWQVAGRDRGEQDGRPLCSRLGEQVERVAHGSDNLARRESDQALVRRAGEKPPGEEQHGRSQPSLEEPSH